MARYLERLMAMPNLRISLVSCKALIINKIQELYEGQYIASADVMVVSRNLQDGSLDIRKSGHQRNIYIKPIKIDVCGRIDIIWPVYLEDMRIKLE